MKRRKCFFTVIFIPECSENKKSSKTVLTILDKSVILIMFQKTLINFGITYVLTHIVPRDVKLYINSPTVPAVGEEYEEK